MDRGEMIRLFERHREAEAARDIDEEAAADERLEDRDLTSVTFIGKAVKNWCSYAARTASRPSLRSSSDSQGIRLLIRLSRRLEAAGAELALVAPSESIAGGVLRLTPVPELRLVDR
jgi:hypothetical protein